MKRHRRHRPKRPNSAPLIFFCFLLGLGVLWAGCSDSPKTPSAPAAAPKQASQQPIALQPAKPEAPKAEEKPDSPYTYEPRDRRDPFAPIVMRAEQGGKPGSGPLERYSVTEYKLTGIIWGGFGYNAMIESPDGKGYFVRVGTVIGTNRGVVKKITQTTMVIEETFKNYIGVTDHKVFTMTLHKKQEGLP